MLLFRYSLLVEAYCGALSVVKLLLKDEDSRYARIEAKRDKMLTEELHKIMQNGSKGNGGQNQIEK